MVRLIDSPRGELRRRRGFSLFEILIVIVIIALLLAASAPTVLGLLKGNQLSISSEHLVSELENARSSASILNAPVTVQFVKTIPTDGSGSASRYLGYRLLQQNSDGSFEIGSIKRFRPGVEPLLGSGFETLLTDSALATETGVNDPTVGPNSADLVSFRFFPDGSTDLPAEPADSPGDRWFLTLVQGSQSSLPSNWIAVAIDPVTGRTFRFQP